MEAAIALAIGILLVVWIIGTVRKIAGCFIHLLLLGAGLLLLIYLASALGQRGA